jgi:hypothetical protein
MDKTTIQTMLESGHASVAHLASHFKVSLDEMLKFMVENEIPVPTMKDPQYDYLRKLQAAQRPGKIDWESLVYDDAEKRVVNGIDTLTTGQDIRPDHITKHYHGDLHCMFTGEPTELVLSIDGTDNFLITNLVPISDSSVKERFKNAPLFITEKSYSFENPGHDRIRIILSFLLRLDITLGASFKDTYVDGTIDQWLAPYFEKFAHRDILGNLPATPEFLALWIWRHLSTIALLKGLAKVQVECDGVSAFVTKDSYLQMVVGMITRAAQSRAIASRPSSIVSPQQAAREGFPLGTGLGTKIIPR